ncbi:MAG: thermonuclease family protein [Candidatus Accumulibacter sp.]|jgi:endonuclease YncB( thermonuclease family)|nr:thermonuclease family protein [Accumulibacter sp.]
MDKMKYLLVFCFFSAVSQAETLRGRIVRVADGDSLTLVTFANRRVEVRIAGIDAPERRQPYGAKSKQALAALCHRRSAAVLTRGKDPYGRTLGQAVYCDGVYVNAAQVASGLAWVYPFTREDPSLTALEREARAGQRGLWRDPAPMPPWEFRKRHPRPHAGFSYRRFRNSRR